MDMRAGHEDEEAAAGHVEADGPGKFLRSKHVDRGKLDDAGNAGPNVEYAAGAARSNDLGLIRQARPPTDQTHIAAQHANAAACRSA